jgi:predicted RNA binding protein YcfA (HicA-like mRNA interferase family)
MSRDEKLIARIKARPVEASFTDVRKVLEMHGWRLARRRGSHITFGKRGEVAIVVPLVRGSKVKGVYLDHIIERLDL